MRAIAGITIDDIDSDMWRRHYAFHGRKAGRRARGGGERVSGNGRAVSDVPKSRQGETQHLGGRMKRRKQPARKRRRRREVGEPKCNEFKERECT